MEGFAYTSLSFRVALFFRPRSRISHFRNFVKVSDFIYLASLLGESPRGGGEGLSYKNDVGDHWKLCFDKHHR